MNIKRAEQFHIKGPGNRIYYGGDQDWFSSNTRAQGGCSSVAAANAFRAFIRTDEEGRRELESSKKVPLQVKEALLADKPAKDCFSIFMTGIYNKMRAFEIPILRRIYDDKQRGHRFFRIIRPNQGQTNTGFIIGIIRFARSMGVNIKVNYMNTAFADEKMGRDFITKGLEKAGSVVMMTSYNKHSIKIFPGNADISKILENGRDSAMKCHFATITDIDEGRLLLTTWGCPATLDYNELVKSWRSIKAFESTLFYIEKADRSEATKCILTAVKAFLGGILQSLSRGKLKLS